MAEGKFGLIGVPVRRSIMVLGVLFKSESPFGLSPDDFSEAVTRSLAGTGLVGYVEVGSSASGTSFIGMMVKDMRDSVVGVFATEDGVAVAGDELEGEAAELSLGRWASFSEEMLRRGVALPPPMLIFHEGFDVETTSLH